MEIELKDIYKHAIADAHIKNSVAAKRFNIKDSCNRSSRFNSLNTTTSSLSNECNCKYYVVCAVAQILYISDILYGSVGEEFFKEKLRAYGETFSQKEYMNIIANGILQNLSEQVKKPIMESFSSAVNDIAEDVEAKVAKASVLRSGYILENEEMYKKVKNTLLSGEEIEFDELLALFASYYAIQDKAEVCRKLDVVFNYLIKNIDVIGSFYKEMFPSVSDVKYVACVISNLSEPELEISYYDYNIINTLMSMDADYTKSRYAKAYSEVEAIINVACREEADRIPQEFKNFLKRRKDEDYVYHVEKGKSLVDQTIMRETKIIFAYIHRNFFKNCNSSGKN